MTLNEILARYKDKDDPNFIGEALRDWAFVKHDEYSYGCYSTFDLIPEFKPMEFTEREFFFLYGRKPDFENNDLYWYDDRDVFKRARWFKNIDNGIEVGWYWDGDGTLAFYIPEDNIVVCNGDCKKSNTWEFIE